MFDDRSLQGKQRTSSLFRYLMVENRELKEEISQLKKLLEKQPANSAVELQRSNSQLREKLLSAEAEMLICRQIYDQEELERLRLIEEYSNREVKYRQRLIKLEEQVKLHEKGINRKTNNHVAVTPEAETLDFVSEVQAVLRLVQKSQDKYEQEKMKRKYFMKRYLENNDSDLSERYMSDDSDNEQYSTEQTIGNLKLQKPNKTLPPKLQLDKAKQVQRLIVQKIQLKQGKNKQDAATLKRQLNELRQKYMEVCIANIAYSKRMKDIKRYVEEIQNRNSLIIKLKVDQVPIEAYQLSRR